MRSLLIISGTGLLALALSACGFSPAQPNVVPGVQPTVAAVVNGQPTPAAGQQPGSTPNPSQPQPTAASNNGQPQAAPILGFTPQAGGPGTQVNAFGRGYTPGQMIVIRLGFPAPMGEALASAKADAKGEWQTQFVMPGTLPSGDVIDGTGMHLVVMNDANQPLASAPFSFTPLPSNSPAPAAAAMDMVGAFLTAAQQGQSIRPYLSAELQAAFDRGDTDAARLLLLEQPITSYTIDEFRADAGIVHVTLGFGQPSQLNVSRLITIGQENGAWRVLAVVDNSPAPSDSPAPAAAATDMVGAFLTAAQQGQSIRPYLSTGLQAAFDRGETDAGRLLLFQNPITSYTIDELRADAGPQAIVRVTLGSGQPSQLNASRLITVDQENGAWRVFAVATNDPVQPTPATSMEDRARAAVVGYLNLLNTGSYYEAAEMYIGDFEGLRRLNPDITDDPTNNLPVQSQLLERACTANGFACFQLRQIVGVAVTSRDEALVTVELNNPDGSQFVLPASGTSQFTFRVQYFGGADVYVSDLPPYVS